jgi:hypothetical protein
MAGITMSRPAIRLVSTIHTYPSLIFSLVHMTAGTDTTCFCAARSLLMYLRRKWTFISPCLARNLWDQPPAGEGSGFLLALEAVNPRRVAGFSFRYSTTRSANCPLRRSCFKTATQSSGLCAQKRSCLVHQMTHPHFYRLPAWSLTFCRDVRIDPPSFWPRSKSYCLHQVVSKYIRLD